MCAQLQLRFASIASRATPVGSRSARLASVRRWTFDISSPQLSAFRIIYNFGQTQDTLTLKKLE